jgi:hypothetical protein
MKFLRLLLPCSRRRCPSPGAGFAVAQGGMVRLTTFGAQTNLTGLGYPCVTSCYVTLTSGTFTINGATPVTVANPLMTANSVVMFGLKTVGGTVSPNMPAVLTVTPGTGFTVGGTAADSSCLQLRNSELTVSTEEPAMKLKRTILAAIGAVALAGIALAQPVITRVTSIGSSDLIQVIPGGAPSAQSVYATSALLGNYSETLTGNNPENALIGGDSTTNLWQRATTGSSVTTTATYGGPDRWTYWSGTNTAMTVSRTTTAGDLPASLTYKSGFKMARTAAQTGVVESACSRHWRPPTASSSAGRRRRSTSTPRRAPPSPALPRQ